METLVANTSIFSLVERGDSAKKLTQKSVTPRDHDRNKSCKTPDQQGGQEVNQCLDRLWQPGGKIPGDFCGQPQGFDDDVELEHLWGGYKDGKKNYHCIDGDGFYVQAPGANILHVFPVQVTWLLSILEPVKNMVNY